jgi:hypothetical protein
MHDREAAEATLQAERDTKRRADADKAAAAAAKGDDGGLMSSISSAVTSIFARKEDAKRGTGHAVIYVIERVSMHYRISVVNTSQREGVQYHACKFAGHKTPSGHSPPQLLYQATLSFDHVPPHKIQDGALWFMLLRDCVWPSQAHSMAVVYENLLPYLTLKPLYVNVAASQREECMQWASLPVDGDPALAHCGVETMRYALAR